MSYLSREASPLSEGLWKQIDAEVVGAARRVLTGRRFLPMFGPLGIGAESVVLDEADALEETAQNGILTTKGRKFAEIPVLFDDFTLLARDLESSEKTGYPVDLSKAAAAAEACALKEDGLIYFGDGKLGYKGLLTAPGAGKLEKKDWAAGENAFSDVAAAIELLASKNVYGTLALSVSPDLYMKMQRLQPGTGLLEIDRVRGLVDGRVYKTPVLGKNKAVLVCAEPRNMDLAVGQDMAAAYLEQKELNHSFRVLESVLPRIKRAQAIVVLA
jgi:uncharacterized linocin/CFP29 family protein